MSLLVGFGFAVWLFYTFVVARFGGCNWMVVSALLLLVFIVLSAFLFMLLVSFVMLLMFVVIIGFGGGNFVLSMMNINLFYL